MLISGKMSVCIVSIETTPKTTMRRATTTKVYGRLSASRTIHMFQSPAHHLFGRQTATTLVIKQGPDHFAKKWIAVANATRSEETRRGGFEESRQADIAA